MIVQKEFTEALQRYYDGMNLLNSDDEFDKVATNIKREWDTVFGLYIYEVIQNDKWICLYAFNGERVELVKITGMVKKEEVR